MKLNRDYNFKEIEMFANENDCQLNEIGGETIGTAFIVLEGNIKGMLISFILTGYNSNEGNIYTCIFNEQ